MNYKANRRDDQDLRVSWDFRDSRRDFRTLLPTTLLPFLAKMFYLPLGQSDAADFLVIGR